MLFWPGPWIFWHKILCNCRMDHNTTMLIPQFISKLSLSLSNKIQDVPFLKWNWSLIMIFDSLTLIWNLPEAQNQNLALLFWSTRNFFKHTKNTQSLVQYLRGDSLCLGSTKYIILSFCVIFHLFFKSCFSKKKN